MKKLLLILLAAAFLFLFPACDVTEGDEAETTQSEEMEILSKPDEKLEFWLCVNVDNVNLSKYDHPYYGAFGYEKFYGSGYELVKGDNDTLLPVNYYVSYIAKQYPDASSDTTCITAITIKDPSSNIYGLTVNSTKEEFIYQFETVMGFTVEKSNNEVLTVKKGDYTVKYQDGSITFLVNTTNIYGVVY